MILQPYGTTIAVAVLVGAWVASLEARRLALLRSPSLKLRRASEKYIWDALPWVLVFGLVGARAYHILHLWEFYRQNLEQVLFVWNGGLAIFGGIFGGLIGLLAYVVLHANKSESKRMNANERMFLSLLDIAAPGIAVAQAIGRFANFFSQELYGWPTNLPWGIYIKPENRFPGLENFEYFHPLFLYEALWCLLGFGLLEWFDPVRGRSSLTRGTTVRTSKEVLPLTGLTGERFLCYLSFYALGRFFLEGMRLESWMVGGVRVAQLLSILIIFGSITIAVAQRMRSKKTENREQKTDTR